MSSSSSLLVNALRTKMRQSRNETDVARNETDQVIRMLLEERQKRVQAEEQVLGLIDHMTLLEKDLEKMRAELNEARRQLPSRPEPR